MSDNIVNIRFYIWHFQIKENWKFNISKNLYHKDNNEGLFRIYDFRIIKKLIN